MLKLLYVVIIFMKRYIYYHENNFVKVHSNVCKVLFYNA